MFQPSSALSVRARALVATLALAALPLAARAVEVPATAVTENTVLVAWLDASSVSGKEFTDAIAEFQKEAQGLSPDQKAKAEKVVKALADLHGQFTAAGGEGVLFGFCQAAKDGDKPEPYLLIKSKPGAERAKFEKMIHGMAEVAKDNDQAVTALLAAKVEKYGNSTEWHAVTGEELAFPPLNGNAKDAGVFNDALKAAAKRAGKGALEMCFRMSEKLKMGVQNQLAAQGKDGNQDMMTAMLGGVLQPMVNLDTVTLVGSGTKGARKVEAVAHFGAEKDAADFAGAANGVFGMAKGMFGMQMAQMAKYGVDQKNAKEMMDALALKGAGSDAVLSLDEAFFAKVETFAKQSQAAKEKMKADLGKGGAAGDKDADADAKALDKAEKDAPAGK